MRLPVPLSTCHPKCFCSVMYEPEWAVNAPQGSFFFFFFLFFETCAWLSRSTVANSANCVHIRFVLV